MDPFTEKLLERTRARRENLQKKMAERPNAANRQMVKRPREPLADTNSVMSEPAIDKVPQVSSKPSPSKRRCSEENVAGAENQEPATTRNGAPMLSDPPTNRKPPVGPASVRPSSSLEKTANRPVVQSQPGQQKVPEPEKVAVTPAPNPPSSREVEAVPASSALQSNKEELVEDSAPSAAGMKSRLQRLAQQRKYWDGDDTPEAVPDCTPLSLMQRQAEVTPAAVPIVSSGAPVGRRGRLANLAATIGSWEDDLSHANIPNANAREKPAAAVPKFAVRDATVATSTKPSAAGHVAASSTASSRSTPSSQALCPPAKPGRVFDPSTQDADIPAARPALKPVTSPQKSSIQGTAFPSSPQKSSIQGTALPSSPQRNTIQGTALPSSPQKSSIQGTAFPSSPQRNTIQGTALPSSPQKSTIQGTAFPSSPQKSSIQGTAFPSSPQKSSIQGTAFPSSPQKSSIQGTAFPSSPQKAGPSSLASVPQSPMKSQALSRGLISTSSPQKPELRARPTTAGPSGPQEIVAAGAPGVKSFLERFGERCQERTNQSSPAGGTPHAKSPTVTPSAVTPTTRLLQERLRAAQAASTTTADLAQRHKLERESELAQIRSRFQKGSNMWKNKDEAAQTHKNANVKEQLDKPVEAEVAPCEPQNERAAPSTESTDTPKKCTPPAGHGLMVSPPTSTSSPLRVLSHTGEKTSYETPEEEEEVVKEKEMNVDQSINSAIINELFDGALEQSDDYDDEEEEDALNISSMSLLTPLAETVAAVVKSPERRMMTSTPATSFIVESNTLDKVSKPSKFQRANVMRGASSDSVEAFGEDPKLPYSIDAYRSTRVKETEKPNLKQVIVRKEDVSNRVEEPRGASLFSIKQKMKILTNELNLQQTVIHQASQALNCCTDEEHGKGSQVEAEAERLLLVATEKREALKAELDRLKGDPTGQKKASVAPEPMSMAASKGSVTLQELRLPLKADFVCSIANKPESTKHSFFVMIRAGAENTVATPLASTHRGLSGDTLAFPTKFTISDVSSDFGIDIEVYCLVQKRDACSDKKKKPSKSKSLWRQVHEAQDLCMSAITPKRFLAITKSGQTPVVASPGGPNAVRTSNFILVGSHKLTLSSIGKNKFPLDKIKYEARERELLSDMFSTKVPFLCPLEGHVYLTMQCEVGSKVEEKGFLTMFEDVSGFGAWHRRWCVLSGYCISYWTYPDDEKRKNPIGRINLANCTSKKVEPANREFCARPNTFELITVRPQREDDKETLVSQCKNTMCVTKNWLSADTKDERNLWMKKVNQIVVDLRMWQPDASYRPL
ncbi:anillin isoform X2 [Etheostoma spectabile]|uniref:anillin isoform X2 n=1 Tax=Etheostoma spectabile TaxID=54343 RepID=UPI0013AFEB6F|nr:anillin isoform X2 [Etheostoma spectabile]